MSNIDDEVKVDYSKFENISLSEVEMYFSSKAFKEINDLNIKNLGDLFRKDASRELYIEFFKKHSNAVELWKSIKGSLLILRCKYLNINPNIDINKEGDYADKIGLSRNLKKRLLSYYSLSLLEIFRMIEENNYSTLEYHFSIEVVNEIINKCTVLYNYYKKQDQKSVISLDELRKLYLRLEEILNEYNEVKAQINYSEILLNIRKDHNKGRKK